MNNPLFLSTLITTLPLLAQAPAQPPPAQEGQVMNLADFPTRKNPYVLKGTMTVTLAAPAYVAVGATGTGSLLKDGIQPAEGEGKGGRKGDKQGADANRQSSSLKSTRSYFINVPPKAKLKVALQCRRLRNFNVRFISDTYGRTEDPGLFVNKLQHRDDAAFYENKSGKACTIHCVLTGVEPMEEEPYALVFTDY